MQIEAGSQNVSRQQGVYAYLHQRYNNAPVTPIGQVGAPGAALFSKSNKLQAASLQFSPDKLHLSAAAQNKQNASIGAHVARLNNAESVRHGAQTTNLDVSQYDSNSYTRHIYSSSALYIYKGLNVDLSA